MPLGKKHTSVNYPYYCQGSMDRRREQPSLKQNRLPVMELPLSDLQLEGVRIACRMKNSTIMGLVVTYCHPPSGGSNDS